MRVNKNEAHSVYSIFHFFMREGTENDIVCQAKPSELICSSEQLFQDIDSDDDEQRMKLRESAAC